MREILFRGKRMDNGEWVEGYLCKSVTHLETFHQNVVVDTIEVYDGESYLNIVFRNVSANSIGQYTGLTDKNGTKIFEGDIIKADNGKQSSIFVVKFGEYCPKMFYHMLDVLVPGKRHLLANGFHAVSAANGEEAILFQSPCTEVIGNIHDNPELLEVSDNG